MLTQWLITIRNKYTYETREVQVGGLRSPYSPPREFIHDWIITNCKKV